MFLNVFRRFYQWLTTPVPPPRPRFVPGDFVAFNGQFNAYEAEVLGFEPGKIALRITKKSGLQTLGAPVGSTVVLSQKRPEWNTILTIKQCS